MILELPGILSPKRKPESGAQIRKPGTPLLDSTEKEWKRWFRIVGNNASYFHGRLVSKDLLYNIHCSTYTVTPDPL
jgi:hypothetical protein